MEIEVFKGRRALLVAALRSGEYRQGRGQLRKEENGVLVHCCLGVACEVFRKEADQGLWTQDHQFVIPAADEVQGDHLPATVRDWYGFRTVDGKCVRNGKLSDLTVLNDIGWSFTRIAVFIEAEPRGLFKEAA
jgi:hypothetical protein